MVGSGGALMQAGQVLGQTQKLEAAKLVALDPQSSCLSDKYSPWHGSEVKVVEAGFLSCAQSSIPDR